MADRYWFGGNGNWINAATRFCNSPPVCFTASTSGTTMTVTAGGTNLAIGMTVYTVGANALGVITGGANPIWTMSVSSSIASITMYAGVAATAPASTDVVYLGGVYAAGSVTGVATAVTIALTGTVSCSGVVVGNAAPITVRSTSGTLNLLGDLNIAAGTIWSATVPLSFSSSLQVSTNGVSLGSSITVSGASGDTCQLASALTTTSSLTITSGTFTTNNYNVTATQLSSSNSNTRAINLGSSTITLSSGINFSTSSGLTFNAGTSQIKLTSTSAPSLRGGGLAFYNIDYTGLNWTSTGALDNVGSANNISVTGRTASGLNVLAITADCSINGTLTLSAGTVATMRTFVRSNTIGTPSTLTVNNFAAGSADIDFRDITIAGAAAPISGTRFGDCKGNSGVTFPAAKTVYWRVAAGGNWGAASWSSTIGGTADVTQMPLAQDTAVFPSLYPNPASTATVNASYNIGTIDMSARTTNTMTLATVSTTPSIYGDWINGTKTTLTGTGTLTFAGRGSQTITSAGKTFTQPFSVESPGGAVTLQDAFVSSASTSFVQSGTFDANGYNVTLSQLQNGASNNVRTIALGSGTLTLTGTSVWAHGPYTNLTVTGTGTISLTSASAKTFLGGGIQTYPTLNQGGTGTLTVTGSNKFANITNTAIGSVLFTGGTTNEFTAFNLNGTSTAARLTLGSTNTTQAILKKPSAWYMGAGSLNAGNNTGLAFSAGGGIDFLAVSYINGQATAPIVKYQGNFFAFF